MLITPRSPAAKAWEMVPHSGQNRLPPHRVKGIAEVELQDYLLWGVVVATVGFRQGYQPRARQHGGPKEGARPWASKDTKPARWAMKASWPPATLASRKCWMRNPVGPGAVSGGKARRHWATVSGATSGQRASSLRGGTEGGGWLGWSALRAATVSAVGGAKASGKQGRASLAVKPFASKAGGESPPLLHGRVGAGTGREAGPGIPQRQALTILPAMQPIQGEGGSGLAVLAPPPRRSTQDALGKHQQLPPCFVIIGVHGSGHGPHQDLPPGVTSRRGNMPEGGGSGSLDVGQRRELQSIRVHGLGLVDGCSSSWPTGWAVALRDAKPAHQAAGPVLGVQPSDGDIALEGARQVCIDMMLHGGPAGPASCPGLVGARAGRDRAKKAGRCGWQSTGWRSLARRTLAPNRNSRHRGSGVLSFTDAGAARGPSAPPSPPHRPPPAVAVEVGHGWGSPRQERVPELRTRLLTSIQGGGHLCPLAAVERCKMGGGWGRAAGRGHSAQAAHHEDGSLKEDNTRRWSHEHPGGWRQDGKAKPGQHTRGPGRGASPARLSDPAPNATQGPARRGERVPGSSKKVSSSKFAQKGCCAAVGVLMLCWGAELWKMMGCPCNWNWPPRPSDRVLLDMTFHATQERKCMQTRHPNFWMIAGCVLDFHEADLAFWDIWDIRQKRNQKLKKIQYRM